MRREKGITGVPSPKPKKKEKGTTVTGYRVTAQECAFGFRHSCFTWGLAVQEHNNRGI